MNNKSGKETPVRLVNGGQSIGANASIAYFLELCEFHNVTPTKRQFSKFRNHKGRLYNAIHKSEA